MAETTTGRAAAPASRTSAETPATFFLAEARDALIAMMDESQALHDALAVAKREPDVAHAIATVCFSCASRLDSSIVTLYERLADLPVGGEAGAQACAVVLRQIQKLVRPTGQGTPDWSPRQLGALILDALHGEPDHATGFADALGLWLAWAAQGIVCDAERFDPVRELAADRAPTAGEALP